MIIESYISKKISELDLNSDRKICIAGTVKEIKDHGNFILDDGMNSIEIINDNKLEFIKSNNKLRVFCTNFDGKIRADIIQDIDNMDLKLFDKVLELYRKHGM